MFVFKIKKSVDRNYNIYIYMLSVLCQSTGYQINGYHRFLSDVK